MKVAKKKAEHVETSMREKDVKIIVDAQAEFVSLVKRGANQKPFRVIKSQGEEVDMRTGEKIVQRIVLSKDLPEAEAKDILKDARTDEQISYGDWIAYEQVAKDDCVPDSFDALQLDERGKALAIVAKLIVDDEGGNIGEAEKKAGEAGEDSEGKGVAVKEAIPWDVGSAIADELYAVQNIVIGVLQQKESGLNFKTETIRNAITYFSDFVQMVLESVGEGTEKVAASIEESLSMKKGRKISKDRLSKIKGAVATLSEIISEVEAQDEKIQKEDEAVDQLFENKEEVESFVTGVIGKVLTGLKNTEEAQKAEADAAKQAKDEKEAAEGKLKTFEDRLDVVEKSTGGSVAQAVEGDPDKPTKKEEKPDVYEGLLLKKAASA